MDNDWMDEVIADLQKFNYWKQFAEEFNVHGL